MKKLLLTLIVALGMCGSSFAQYESYWPDFNGNMYPFQKGLVAGIMINGEIIDVNTPNWDALEVAAFVGDVVRANQMYLYDGYVLEYGDPYPILDGLAIYYATAGDEVSFKMYDHVNETLYENCEILYLGEPMVILTGEQHFEGWDDPENPIFLSFTSPAATGITKDITPWTVETTEGEQKANGWYLLASPVGTIDDATTVTNLLSNNYDLYAFNEAQLLEWLNYDGDEALEYAGHFSIEAGKGYLYANSGDGVSETVTLTFPGNANTNDVTISLAKTEGAVFEGWNLIGNPFNENYPMGNRSFYVMNEDGTEVGVANRNYLEPMEGAFISTEQDGEEFTFSLIQHGEPGILESVFAINLGQSNKIVDRAVVSIGESRSELPKFQLNPNHTKVFIPKEGKDYAVVSTGEMGEMPVNFKAEKSGTYTMNLSSENVKFSYLHLIDNLTGNDVDLLANPTYSFNAQTTDYASRFRLVFATDNSVNSDSFGFVNNSGNFCVYGIEGEATLQVYDVLGHMLSSETFSGSIEKKVNAATGVYMMRLINGNDVKVQKVIIK